MRWTSGRRSTPIRRCRRPWPSPPKRTRGRLPTCTCPSASNCAVRLLPRMRAGGVPRRFLEICARIADRRAGEHVATQASTRWRVTNVRWNLNLSGVGFMGRGWDQVRPTSNACALDKKGRPLSMNLAEVASELASMSEEETAAETTTALENDGATAGDPCEVGPLLFRLLCADDLSQPAARYPLLRIGEASFARSRVPAAEIKGSSLRLGLKDRFASPSHARLEQDADGSWQIRDEASTNGTLVNSEPVRPGDSVPLRDGDLLEMGHTFFLFRASAVGTVPASRGPDSFEGEPLTLNPEWELELSRADRLARTCHEVLIQGESGAGKEVLARFLHSRSRRKGPLVSVNCGALAENLLEDELFGHVRGAFSGAHADRQGLVRAADGGTLFLDEVGDMAPGLQVKLLRVLEDRKVRPVGSEKEISVDVRVIAATNRKLDDLVAQGTFRADPLARLGLLPLRVPALRDRREDLGLLVRAIL